MVVVHYQYLDSNEILKKKKLTILFLGKAIKNCTESEKVKVKSLSRVRFFATPWTVAYQASLFMGFSQQGYWSGLLFPFPEKLYYIT